MVEAEAPLLAPPKTKEMNKEFNKWASMLGGSVAGAASKTCTAPLSRMTILMQIQGARSPGETHLSKSRPGVIQSIRDVAKAEGFRSLWRGNLTSVFHKFPSGGINYFVYESSKIFLRPFWRSESDPGIRIRFGCGFLGGTAASALTYPLDIIRTRLAANTSVGQSLSLRSAVDGLIAEGGVRALFKGVGVTLVCQGTNIALNFAMYETLQIRAIALERRMWEALGWPASPKKQRGSFITSLACGACAGVTASTIIFPLDLVRRRQQITKGKSDSGLEVIRGVLRKEGFRGLYQGLGPELLKVVPGVAINFYVYELVRQEILGANIAPR